MRASVSSALTARIGTSPAASLAWIGSGSLSSRRCSRTRACVMLSLLGDAFDRQAAVEQPAVGAGPRERVEVDALVVLDHRFDQQVAPARSSSPAPAGRMIAGISISAASPAAR